MPTLAQLAAACVPLRRNAPVAVVGVGIAVGSIRRGLVRNALRAARILLVTPRRAGVIVVDISMTTVRGARGNLISSNVAMVNALAQTASHVYSEVE